MQDNTGSTEYVTLPASDYRELSTAAWTTQTPTERAVAVAHTTFVFAAMAGAVGAGTWLWSKVRDRERSETEKHERRLFKIRQGEKPDTSDN